MAVSGNYHTGDIPVGPESLAGQRRTQALSAVSRILLPQNNPGTQQRLVSSYPRPTAHHHDRLLTVANRIYGFESEFSSRYTPKSGVTLTELQIHR